MQLGDFMLVVALVATLGAIAAYIIAAVGWRELASLGRTAYLASTAAITVISAYFMWLILGNHFELEYIFSNSSRGLPLYYKISVFWAGQQGSFLFWALCGGILGIFVMLKSKEFEAWLMAFWSALQGLFLVLLLVDSPFKPMQAGMDITDGRGLRELLQNPWMAIHPPLVFIGYAAMCVPAAFIIAALIRNDLRTWCRTTLPWTIFGWITLGAGIIVGAYWAYEVLGWGGYWGWDPVENASLVPWLTGTALLHGMIAERHRGSFRRTNVVLALATFLFVFYSTFLTRSDALKDFSVHTFGDARIGGPLIWFMGAFIVISAFLALWRWRRIESAPSYTAVNSRDFAFFLAIICFVVVAGFVVVGTSAPIIAKGLSGAPVIKQFVRGQGSVDTSFYNRTNAPVALIIVALMALAPLLSWRGGEVSRRLLIARVLVAHVALALIAAFAGTFLSGPRTYFVALGVAIAAVALVALIVNAYVLMRMRKFGLRALGGLLVHIGMGLFFLAVVLSASSGRSETVTLAEGAKPVVSHGYSFAYEGTKEFSERMAGLMIRVNGGGKMVHAMPTMQVTRDNEILARPHIVKSFARDLYIAPKSIPGPERKWIERGKQIPVQDFQLTFIGFEVPSGHGQGEVRIGARIAAQAGEEKAVITPLLVARRSPARSGAPLAIPGTGATISVDRISVEQKAVEVTLTPRGGSPQSLFLTQGEKTKAGAYELTFKKWIVREPEGGHGGDFRVTVQIDVGSGSRTTTAEPVYVPRQDGPQTTTVSEPVAVPGADATVQLTDVDVNAGRVLVTVTPTVETAVVDVSVKPFMSLLWLGSVLALAGGGVAMLRRSAEAGGVKRDS